MKIATILLWVPMDGDRGQRRRRCSVVYSINSIGSKTLYEIESISDLQDQQAYPVERTLGINPQDMDTIIAAADPKQVAFAKKELGVDLKNMPKKKILKKPIQKIETNDLLSGL
jgi:hypothetical protein